MLVEHKRKLRRLKAEEKEREKPDLDSQRLEEMNYILAEAIKEEREVAIVYYKDKYYQTLKGVIKKCLPESKQLVLVTGHSRKQLYVDEIIEINLM